MYVLSFTHTYRTYKKCTLRMTCVQTKPCVERKNALFKEPTRKKVQMQFIFAPPYIYSLNWTSAVVQVVIYVYSRSGLFKTFVKCPPYYEITISTGMVGTSNECEEFRDKYLHLKYLNLNNNLFKMLKLQNPHFKVLF